MINNETCLTSHEETSVKYLKLSYIFYCEKSVLKVTIVWLDVKIV